MKPKRRVAITICGQVWFVRYLDRRLRQHYCAAQFDRRDNSYAKVKAWVMEQKNLEIVEI